MSTAMQECERTARDEGLAAGLDAALSGIEVTGTAPGRYAAVSIRQVPAGSSVRTHSIADREDVVFVECPGERPGGPRVAEVGRLLAAVRLGLARRLLDQAVEHLTERTGGGEPLIRKQMVTGNIADIIGEVELLRAYAQSRTDPAAVGDLHNRIDDLGRQVAKLFGAIGYIADHPARALYVSSLVANTWIGRQGAEE
ncbi:acyl-CoA dehydrogenase family protein [Actinacidiphila sp. ITFR-21]|uniref:acyl-CoA dehydrogenase family protein n=1 Tax=Actinacidiphila sp. ITFR-21 TaxID=3075199 RepID=UPI00288AC417|nr:acyl-CoA dehydrogenase family protein [Streptomyces sp. ITFR-21]WNI18955.1 acyl-CoA dehydrogenase family protein [Streptomyces sp. ITFR-21]